MSITLAELAQQLELEHIGDCEIDGVADISDATSGSIAFIYTPKYEKYLETTKASALIVSPAYKDKTDIPRLVAEQPRLIYAKVAQLLYPREQTLKSISELSSIDADVELGNDVGIDDYVVIKSGGRVGDNTSVGAGSYIGHDVEIGNRVSISANVTILDGCVIGDGCILHPGVVVGADGFGFVAEGDRQVKIPQVGRVIIGEDVEIGANTTIDRGAIRDTVIERGVKLDNQIQVAHNVFIGENTVVSAATAIAGSTKIGRDCLIGGCVAIADNIEITDKVMITGRTLVSGSILKSGSYSSSTPIDETVRWRKNSARFRSLDALARRVTKLEKLIDSSAEDEPDNKKS